MGVRKKGNSYEARHVSRGGESEVFLGSFDCKKCAQRAVDVALYCLDFSGLQHGDNSDAISEARRLGIKEKLEEFLGFELSENEANRLSQMRDKERIEHELSKALNSHNQRAIKRKELYKAKNLIHVIPTITVEYPTVPIATVPISLAVDALPETSGVYFVWYDDTVEYVGQAINLKNRVTERHERIFDGDRVSWLEFPVFSLNFAESYYIGVTCPSRNFGKFAKRLDDKQDMAS